MYLCNPHRGVEQLVARRAHNPEAGGSSPPPATKQDTGNGIPEELKDRVFEPFFRVDKSRSRELGGVGLGLALVREIVIVHDGNIAVKSNPSGGTIFEVVL